MTSAIQVIVRIRPLNDKESSTQSIVRTVSNSIYLEYSGERKKFTYDAVFDNTPQQDLFNHVGVNVLLNAFQGYNCCLFAYGQTSSGKTFTMNGIPSAPGIIPSLCEQLFARQAVESVKMNNCKVTYDVKISYCEIYLENIRDLLSDRTDNLKIRDNKGSPYVENLQEISVQSASQILALLAAGNKRRVTAATQMNLRSSRSHAVFTILFKQIIIDGNTGKPKEIRSKINLVDLAGSERIDLSGVTGLNRDEATKINQSLTTLGRVLTLLSQRNETTNTAPHIPYRDSVLTQLLSESLGGNSKTIMISNISPSSLCYSETLSTLRYSLVAKKVILNAKINEETSDKIINNMKSEIEMLRQELSQRGKAISSADKNRLEEEIKNRERMFMEEKKMWEQNAIQSQQLHAEHIERVKKEEQEKAHAKLEEQKRQHEEELQRTKDKRLTEEQISMFLRANHGEDKRRQSIEMDSMIAAIKSDHEKNMAIMKAEYEKNLMIKEAEYGKQISSIRAEYEKQIVSQKLLCDKKIEDTATDVEPLKKQIIGLKEQIDRVTADLEQSKKALSEEQRRSARQVHVLQTKIQRMERDKEHDTLSSKSNDDKLDAANQKFLQIKLSIKQELDNLRKLYGPYFAASDNVKHLIEMEHQMDIDSHVKSDAPPTHAAPSPPE